MKTKLSLPRIRVIPPVMIGWIGCLLLLAIAGCRTTSQVSAPAASSAIAQSNASTIPISKPSLLIQLPPPQEAIALDSATKRPIEVGPPLQLASLETNLAVGALPMKLEDAILLSLKQNPNLTAVRASEPVAQAAFRVAEVYPWNPQLQAQVLPFSRDRNGNDGVVSQQYLIMQTFEFGGQQRFRRGAAAANLRQVSNTILQAELMNAAQTTRFFFTALYQRELRDMSRSLADLNEQLVGVMQRRQKAGQANPADVELARLQSQSSRRQQRLAEASYQTSLMILRNHLNLDADAPLDLDSRWIHIRWQSLDELVFGRSMPPSKSGSLEGLTTASYEAAAMNRIDEEITLRQLVAERPDVVAARAATTMALENRRLANAMRRPNLLIGPMWQRDEVATQTWGFQSQVNIPIINTGKPLVRQRISQQRQQRITATQLENRAVLQARAAIQRYERARRLVEQSRSEVAFDIPAALTPFEDQFKAGQITLLQVFAARAAIAQSRQGFLGLLNELALAAADVVQATGVPPQQMMLEAEPLPRVIEEAPTP